MHFWIAGTALLVLRGSPEAGGITIDTATEPEVNPIIDEWATSDVSYSILLIMYYKYCRRSLPQIDKKSEVKLDPNQSLNGFTNSQI